MDKQLQFRITDRQLNYLISLFLHMCWSRLKYAILLNLLVITSSCTRTLLVTTYLPPEINPEVAFDSIVLISRIEPEKLDFALFEEKKQRIYAEGVRNLLDGIKEGFSERNIEANVSETTLPIDSSANYQAEIEALNSISPNHVIVSLDSFELAFEMMESYEDDEGDIIADYDLVCSQTLSLYDHQGRKITSTTYKARNYYKSRGALFGFIYADPTLIAAGKESKKLSRIGGLMYADKFYPTPIVHQLTYYSSGPFRKSARQIERQEFPAAKENLLTLANSSEPEVSGRAANNLFVIHEFAGEWEEADYWREKAMEAGELTPANQSYLAEIR